MTLNVRLEGHVCDTCGRPVVIIPIPEFCGDLPDVLVHHNDGGDSMFCYDDGRTDEAKLSNAWEIVDGQRVEFYGRELWSPDQEKIKAMTSPVICTHCGGIYDLTTVSDIIARHSDCTVFKSPCCNRTVDDRTWVSAPDIRRMR